MKNDDTPMYDDPSQPAFVRELLQAGRRVQVPYDVERGLLRHLEQIGAQASAGGSAAPLAAAAKIGAAASWYGVLALPLAAASVAGLLWFYSAGSSPAAPAAVATAPSPAPRAIVAPLVPPAVAAEPVAVAASSEPVLAAEPGQARATERRKNTRRSAHLAARSARSESNALGTAADDAARVAESVEASAPRHVASAAPDPRLDASARSEERAEPASESVAASAANAAAERVARTADSERAAAKPEKNAAAAAAGPSAARDESSVERELQMLAVAQRVLTSDPERTLRLSRQGEREFSGSMLSAERRQLSLLALVKLGRLDDARRAGKPFLQRYPNAPWSARLRHALATGRVE